jgi:hypothetical protein
MIENLKMAMPDGMDILDAKIVFGKSQSLSAALNRVVYVLSDCSMLNDVDKVSIANQMQVLMKSDKLEIERETKSEVKIVDVRPGIYDLHFEDDRMVMLLGVGQGRYVRPTEVSALILPDHPGIASALPFHRQDMYRLEDDGSIRPAMEL